MGSPFHPSQGWRPAVTWSSQPLWGQGRPAALGGAGQTGDWLLWEAERSQQGHIGSAWAPRPWAPSSEVDPQLGRLGVPPAPHRPSHTSLCALGPRVRTQAARVGRGSRGAFPRVKRLDRLAQTTRTDAGHAAPAPGKGRVGWRGGAEPTQRLRPPPNADEVAGNGASWCRPLGRAEGVTCSTPTARRPCGVGGGRDRIGSVLGAWLVPVGGLQVPAAMPLAAAGAPEVARGAPAAWGWGHQRLRSRRTDGCAVGQSGA